MCNNGTRFSVALKNTCGLIALFCGFKIFVLAPGGQRLLTSAVETPLFWGILEHANPIYLD